MTACAGQSSAGQPRGPLTVEGAILGTGQERLARVQQVNDLVAECMRRNGWEYTSEPARTEAYQGFYDSLSSETASMWGYGITATLTRGGEFDAEFGVNPNSTSRAQRNYADALEGDAYAQYMRDLSGARVSDALEGSEESLDSNPYYAESCQGQAESEVYGEVVFVDQLGLEEMIAQANEETGLRLVAEGYEDKWAECMKEHGYEFTKLGSANQYIHSKLVEILDEGSDAMSEEAFSALEELEAEELSVAGADVGCMELTGLLDRSEELLEESVASIFGESTRR